MTLFCRNDLGAIRPPGYFQGYHAILMEEYPALTLRQLLIKQWASPCQAMEDLVDSAQKTGQWLHCFHHTAHMPVEAPFAVQDVLKLYPDLGWILTHPETFKAQIFSSGACLPESV